MKRIGVIILCLMSWGALAQEPVVLTISGNTERHERYQPLAEFTLSELQALPQTQIATGHPWSELTHSYKGPELAALLDELFTDEHIETLYLQALNGFSVAVDWQQLAPYQPVLAWSEDEHPMSRRGKGPIWLMLAYDSLPAVQQAEFLHYMAWQLRYIKVKTAPR